MSIVARKYAQAIFQCGREQGKLKQYKAEFSARHRFGTECICGGSSLPSITPEQR